MDFVSHQDYKSPDDRGMDEHFIYAVSAQLQFHLYWLNKLYWIVRENLSNLLNKLTLVII